MVAALPARPSAGEIAKQGLCSAVNFGIASVARVLGAPSSALLDLRCECGSTGCAARVRIPLLAYRTADLRDALLVVPEHIPSGTSTRITAQGWAIIAAKQPGTEAPGKP